jgi:prepilin-type N-terminal cleavage/methylation domain-containing protein
MELKKNTERGFTLIELLVVIAIIGILSSVVMASLNGARTKASDVDVRATMKQIGSQAEIYRDASVNFGLSVADCATGIFSDERITQAKENITANAATGATIACSTNANGEKWAMSVSALKGGGSWCIDNSGWFKAGVAAAGLCS